MANESAPLTLLGKVESFGQPEDKATKEKRQSKIDFGAGVTNKKCKTDTEGPEALGIQAADSGAVSVISGAVTISPAQGQGVLGGLRVVEKVGDLFACASDTHGAQPSLAHCVSVDLRMGAGIAKLFRNKFGRVPELVKQGPRVGGVVQLKLADNRFVYYLVTKKCYNDKPTYDTLRSSLHAMRVHCESHAVTRLAMPRIGCGLDRLEWPRVRQIVEEVFASTDITIEVYSI